jgi:molecular chaperone DnaK
MKKYAQGKNLLIDFLAAEFKKENGIDLKTDLVALQRLRDASEKAKIELSSAQQTKITIPYLSAGADGPKHLDVTLTRANFEKICDPIFERLKNPVKQALKDAKMPKIDKVILVGGSTRIPLVQKIVQDLTGLVPDKSVNPDEAVSLGAAIQGAIISGDVKDILLLDVTPLTLGIETMGGLRVPLIERNTTIPTRKSEVFTTAADGQHSVTINVLQGEREFARDNKSLGTFRLDGILPAPRGVPQIEVTFDIDANGILSVTAKDKGSGKEQSITITGASTLPNDEVERLVKESEQSASADKEKREKVDLKNQADSLCYQSEKQVEELKEKINLSDKENIMNLITKLKSAIANDSYDEIKSLSKNLQDSLMLMRPLYLFFIMVLLIKSF